MGFAEIHFPNGDKVVFGQESRGDVVKYCDQCAYFKPSYGGRDVRLSGADFDSMGETIMWICADCHKGS